MTSSEKVLFNEIAKNLQASYPEVKVEHPYNDGYMVFSVNGTDIGGFNADGNNFLYCLVELGKIYEFELR